MGVKLLAATYAYPPMRFPRAVQIARLLSAFDDRDVAVLCADEPEALDVGLQSAYPDGEKRVVRVPWTTRAAAYRRWRDRTLETRLLVPDRFRPWLRAAERAARRERLTDDAALLVTFGQPMSAHVLGLRLRRRHALPWIAHFSDPWVENPFRGDGRVARAANERLERAVFATADRLVFTSDETVDLVFARYDAATRRKAVVVPHAFDPRLYRDAPRHSRELVVRYLGAFYGARGPAHLLDALRALDKTELDGVHVELIGPHEHDLLPDALRGLPDGLVSVRDPVPYLESLELMRASDLLLVLDAPADRSVFLPSKLVDYLGARRPIVALTPPGTAASLVEHYGGWTADPTDAHASAAGLRAALAAARAMRHTDFGNPRVVARYEIEQVANEFRRLVTTQTAAK